MLTLAEQLDAVMPTALSGSVANSVGMTIAVAGAMVINEWFEAATVAFLFSLSLAIEGWSIGRARRAVEALLDLAPSSVRVKDQTGDEHVILATEATVGVRFIGRAGRTNCS